jgi:hypothetical protein
MFKYDGTFVTNWKGNIMCINGDNDGEGRHLDAVAKSDKISCMWDVVYADEWKGEPTKGELNEDFGLYVERPFYIVTQLASHRYLDLINNRNMVIKTPNGRNTQEWYFHQQSLTIRTKLNNQSFNIASNGGANNMQIWSTNSNWW